MTTLPPEKWGLKESADWWSAGQAARQQSLGAATEVMLVLAGVRVGSRELDVAAGLDAGAIDYVTKPFKLAERMARIRAQLRRIDSTLQSRSRVGDRGIEGSAGRGGAISAQPWTGRGRARGWSPRVR